MKSKTATTLVTLLLLAMTGTLRADVAKTAAPATSRDEVAALLQEFLARVDEPAMHDRFWAADLIYTGSSGKVQTKADIMHSFAGLPGDAGKTKEPKPTYTADDIIVRPYGDTAALTFRLVAHNPDGKINHYRNSGTFIRRDGRWQVVSWQATKVPPVEN